MTDQQIGEGANALPTWFVVPVEFLDEAKKFLGPDQNLLGLDMTLPIANQLFMIPYGVRIQPLCPSALDAELVNEFLTAAYQGILVYQLSQQSYGQFAPHWTWNALENYEAFKTCQPVNNLKKNPDKDFALICGNGTSFHQQIHDIPDNAEVFAAWSVVQPLLDAGKRVDYACHLDHMHLDGWAESLPCPAISRPEADPTFVRMAT